MTKTTSPQKIHTPADRQPESKPIRRQNDTVVQVSTAVTSELDSDEDSDEDSEDSHPSCQRQEKAAE